MAVSINIVVFLKIAVSRKMVVSKNMVVSPKYSFFPGGGGVGHMLDHTDIHHKTFSRIFVFLSF